MLKESRNSQSFLSSLSLFLGTGILLFSSIHAGSSVASDALSVKSSSVSTSQESDHSNQQFLPVDQISQLPGLSAQVRGNNRLLGQVTSVSQLSDVRPTDWAFQALQSLVERYGCIAGYADRTYRGYRTLTRYEFAAGLNACLNRVNELIAAATSDLVRKEDLTTIQKLQEQFAAELATLRGRVDQLEARTATLQKQQFSTTTKLQGDAVFIAADTFGDRANNTPTNDTQDDTQASLGYRVRLTLPTSFTGKDLLFIRFAANNVPPLQGSLTGTAETRLTIDKGSFPEGSLYLDSLHYRFPLGNKTTVWVGTRQLQPVVFAPNLNPLIGGLTGAISRFATHNPTIYRPGFDGAGVALSYEFSRQLKLGLGYLVDDTQAPNPALSRGIFSGNNLIYSQLTFSPSREFDIAFSYGRKYFGSATGFNLTGGTGSAFARNPFEQNATVSDNFGLQFLWRTSPTFQVGGWFGYTQAHQVQGGGSEATILNGALALAFPDLFKKGNLGGIIVGVPPKATSNDYQSGAARRVDPNTSLHLEAFYTFQLNKNVSVTPNVFVITNPEHNSNNGTIWVGTLRTNFSF